MLGFNLSLENSTITAFQGSGVVVAISTGYLFSYTRGLNLPPVTGVLSASDVQTNVTLSFEPNPLVSPWYDSLLYIPARPNSVLTLNIGNATPPGFYTIGITSVNESSELEYPLTNSTILTLMVRVCTSHLSQIGGWCSTSTAIPKFQTSRFTLSAGKKCLTKTPQPSTSALGHTLPPDTCNVSAYLQWDLSHPYFS